MEKNLVNKLNPWCLCLFVVFAAFCQAAEAAAPLMHAVLGFQWIEKHEQYNDEEKRGFILGTLFPDIRYLGVISREATHEKDVTLEKLLEKQHEFKKGMRLHAFVDKQRERLIAKWKIYPTITAIDEHKHKVTFLKLLEDEILFAKREWLDIQKYLRSIHHEERQFNITDENIEEWHQKNLLAFTMPPSQYLKIIASRHKSFSGIPSEILLEWSELLERFSKDKNMQAYVDKLLIEFNHIYTKKLN